MTGNRRSRNENRRRSRTRLCAAGAVTMLAVSVCGVSPAGAAAASGGGKTSLADDSQCTTKATGVTVASNQAATPWEISYANTQSSGMTGKGVTVAIIDSGIAGSDTQLSKRVVDGKDFTDGGNYKKDVDGHGSMVASIIAAQASTQNGMVGIAPGVNLLIYREAGCNVGGAANQEATLATAINTAVAKGARIINISQAGYEDNKDLKAAIVNAYQRNVLIVAAAGNYGNSAPQGQGQTAYGINPVTYPAAYVPYVLTVGAATQDGSTAEFSETGAYISVTAPGYAVGGLFPDGKVWYDNGTSFAAPYVAGVAALLIQGHPAWSVNTLMKVLESTADGNGAWTRSAGWGVVNANAALQANPDTRVGLFGAGPNADGPAAAKPVKQGIAMQPIVEVAPPQVVVNQRRGAYIALGSAILIVVVTLAGTFIARDARRRRLPL